jgi:hypothetical protein
LLQIAFAFGYKSVILCSLLEKNCNAEIYSWVRKFLGQKPEGGAVDDITISNFTLVFFILTKLLWEK